MFRFSTPCTSKRRTIRNAKKRNWARIGCYIFGISYDTYLAYLKVDTSDISEIPSEAVVQMQVLTDNLLGREKCMGRKKERTK